MEYLNQHFDLDKFFKSFSRASQAVLMLDYDGTLAPFTTERDRAYPYPGVCSVLNEIMACQQTRVVIISGRSIRDLTVLIELKQRPEMWGAHGWEHLSSDGVYLLSPLPDRAVQELAVCRKWLIDNGNLQIEDKPVSCAVHWRGETLQSQKKIQGIIKDWWQRTSCADVLEMHEFDGGIEIRVPGRHKGHAVQSVMADVHNDAACAYLGDDRTDEDAFGAIGVRGLSIIVRNQKRPSSADIWIRPPEELLAFLNDWANACRLPG